MFLYYNILIIIKYYNISYQRDRSALVLRYVIGVACRRSQIRGIHIRERILPYLNVLIYSENRVTMKFHSVWLSPRILYARLSVFIRCRRARNKLKILSVVLKRIVRFVLIYNKNKIRIDM